MAAIRSIHAGLANGMARLHAGLDYGADELAASGGVRWRGGGEPEAASSSAPRSHYTEQMSWPLPEEYAGEAEDAEGVQFREVDIPGELSRVSSEGLTEVETATLAADCLR